MLASLMPGLRNLRVAFICGALMLGSLWVLFGEQALANTTIRPAARDILGLSSLMPIVMIGLVCLFAGSLYVTALEGLVDWLHRRTIHINIPAVASRYRRRTLEFVCPLSASAKQRLTDEAGHIYDELSAAAEPPQEIAMPREQFVRTVAAEVLWLEGKLAGTYLEAPYDQYRSEGEFRLATALLIPLAAVATLYALRVGTIEIVVFALLVTAASAKLADYGFYYYRKAHSFLAHHIADGKVLTPILESVYRSRRGQQDTVGMQPSP